MLGKQQNEVGPLPNTVPKNQLKMHQRPKGNSQTIKPLDESMRHKLYWTCQWLLRYDTKVKQKHWASPPLTTVRHPWARPQGEEAPAGRDKVGASPMSEEGRTSSLGIGRTSGGGGGSEVLVSPAPRLPWGSSPALLAWVLRVLMGPRL